MQRHQARELAVSPNDFALHVQALRADAHVTSRLPLFPKSPKDGVRQLLKMVFSGLRERVHHLRGRGPLELVRKFELSLWLDLRCDPTVGDAVCGALSAEL